MSNRVITARQQEPASADGGKAECTGHPCDTVGVVPDRACVHRVDRRDQLVSEPRDETLDFCRVEHTAQSCRPLHFILKLPASNDGDEFIRLERLRDTPVKPVMVQIFVGQFEHAVGKDRHAGQRPFRTANGAGRIEAVQTRHLDVHDDKRRLSADGFSDRIVAVHGLDYVPACARQGLPDNQPISRFVIDDQCGKSWKTQGRIPLP